MGKIFSIQIALICFLAGFISVGNNAGVPSEQKQERMISSVETNGSWVYLYDAKGNKYKTLTASYVGEVKGWSSTFFVSRNGSWIYTWNKKGDKINTRTAH